MSPRRTASACTRGDGPPWYLIAFPSRFCSTWTISPRSAITVGSGPAVTSASASAIAADRLRTATLQAASRSVGSGVVSPRPMREYSSSSAISESMRLAPATARSMNSRPVVVEPLAMAAREQPEEAGDRAQRLAQVVRGDVGEALQLGVRAGQVGLALAQALRSSARRARRRGARSGATRRAATRRTRPARRRSSSGSQFRSCCAGGGEAAAGRVVERPAGGP